METQSIEDALQSKFALMTRTLGANEATEKKWTAEFIARYTEPQRHYHTLDHIQAMLECLELHRPIVKNERAMMLAIFFHDWIYDPKSKDNEIKSIECFKIFSGEINLSDAIYSHVAGYIERTITHTLPSDVQQPDSDLCLFLDFDLEVLSRSDTAYARYAAEIRAEYSHMKLANYCVGRVAVLRSFLARTQARLYFSDVFYESCEQKARENIEQEIRSLHEQNTIVD